MRSPTPAEQRDKDIEEESRHHRNDQHPADFAAVKVELLGSVGDALKADEGPGGDDRDFHDLRQRGGVRDVGGLQNRAADDGADEADDNAGREQAGQADHHLVHGMGEAGAEPAHQKERRNRQQRLADKHVIAENRVELSEAEDAAEEDTAEQGQRGGVGPEDGKIGHCQEPGGQEALVAAKDLAREGIGAARFREAAHQIGIAAADHQHDQRADSEPEHAAQRPRLCQIGAGRHHQRAPADAGADGEGPRGHR